METIKFSQNWNYKLFTKNFTTIRLFSKKYQVGKMYEIEFNGTKIEAECISVTPILLHNIPEYVFLTDTGYYKDESIKMIETMYKKHNIDFSKYPMAIIVFKQNIEY
jgi:hypothetical protein